MFGYNLTSNDLVLTCWCIGMSRPRIFWPFCSIRFNKIIKSEIASSKSGDVTIAYSKRQNVRTLKIIITHLTLFDLIWPHLTSFDLIWPRLTSFDLKWPHQFSDTQVSCRWYNFKEGLPSSISDCWNTRTDNIKIRIEPGIHGPIELVFICHMLIIPLPPPTGCQ